jgi:protein-tyrosine-phosphatase
VPLGPDGKYQVMFVCTGNLCRSPMAEGLLKLKVTGLLKKRLRVISAGTHALEGMPSTMRGQMAAARFGVDLSHHRSQPVTPWLIGHSDLILAMDSSHVEALHRLDPQADVRVFLLKEYGLPADHPGGILFVDDPMPGDDFTYTRVYQDLDEEINRLIPLLQKVVPRVG